MGVPALQLGEPPLQLAAEQIAAEPAVAAPHAVARHDERHRIPPERRAHRPHRVRMADALGDPRIRAGLAEGDALRRFEHAPLEVGRSGQVDGHREEGAPAGEVLHDLLSRLLGDPARGGRRRLVQRARADQAHALGRGLDGEAPLEPAELLRVTAAGAEHPPGQAIRRRPGLEVVVEQIIETVRGREISHGSIPLLPSSSRSTALPRASWLFTVLTEMPRIRASSP